MEKSTRFAVAGQPMARDDALAMPGQSVATAVADIADQLQVTRLTVPNVRAHLTERGVPADAFTFQWLRDRLRIHVAERLQPMFPTTDPEVVACILEDAASIEQAISWLTLSHPQQPSVELAEGIILLPELLNLLMQYLGLSDRSVRLVCKMWRDAVSEWRMFQHEQTRQGPLDMRPAYAAAPAAGGLLISGSAAGRQCLYFWTQEQLAGQAWHGGALIWDPPWAPFGLPPGGVACSGDTVYVADTTGLQALPITGELVRVPRSSIRRASDQPAQLVGSAAGVWPVPEGETQLSFAEGVAIAGGEVFVCDRMHHRVLVYNAETLEPVRSFGATWGIDAAHQPLQLVAAGRAQWQPSRLHSPEGIAVHGSEVFVADSALRRVVCFDRTRGAYVREVGPFSDEVRGVAAVPSGESPLAHALLLVSTPMRVHVRLLESGEPWQVIGSVGGGGICWSPDEGRAYLMGGVTGQDPQKRTSVVHVLRLHALGSC